jgi:hypothetical protein
VFPVMYELNFHILFRRHLVFKELILFKETVTVHCEKLRDTHKYPVWPKSGFFFFNVQARGTCGYHHDLRSQ